jgi:hypothetical protein
MGVNMFAVNISKSKIIKDGTLLYDIGLDGDHVTVNLVEGSETINLEEEVKIWIEQNIKGKYTITFEKILFEYEEEAVLFKTVWI